MIKTDAIKGLMQVIIFVREHNNTIPDEVLDFIKDATYREIARVYEPLDFEEWWEKKGICKADMQPIMIQAFKDLCKEAWDAANSTKKQ